MAYRIPPGPLAQLRVLLVPRAPTSSRRPPLPVQDIATSHGTLPPLAAGPAARLTEQLVSPLNAAYEAARGAAGRGPLADVDALTIATVNRYTYGLGEVRAATGQWAGQGGRGRPPAIRLGAGLEAMGVEGGAARRRSPHNAGRVEHCGPHPARLPPGRRRKRKRARNAPQRRRERQRYGRAPQEGALPGPAPKGPEAQPAAALGALPSARGPRAGGSAGQRRPRRRWRVAGLGTEAGRQPKAPASTPAGRCRAQTVSIPRQPCGP
jgi:hypothetical protein